MMAYRTLILMIGLGAALLVRAQTTTAEAYFNQASKEYVKQDKMQALRTLDHGLQQYPGDPKLLKLAEELVKEEEKKDQQKQKQEQEKKDQEKQDQEKQDQEKKDQEKSQDQKEQEKKDQQQAEKDQQKKEQEKQEQAQQGDPKDQKGQPKPGSIAPQDAMRMLDALERSEKDVQEKVRAKRRPASRRTIEKDW